ncbi:MmcQ/YjbR family DNA-binding protein [Massilia sp. TSP1-1-2]|uniref:MmcQ/YjbR family DNA-binding protein n=1 Tax=Massilia sp. TSP1-1-2 TaxID=2804649 RepID=UPI003CEA524C
MSVKTLKQMCQDFPGVQHALDAHPSNILVYCVGDKKFAYFKTSDPEMWRFSIRVAPERFLELTDITGIKPARYMGRFHWVTIVDHTVLPAAYLAELVAWSYERALGSLSKASRAALVKA